MINGAAEPVEGSSEQATASTGHEGEGEEEPMATATQPGEEKEKVTEEKSPGDNSVDNQPTENAEGNARVTEENSDHEDKGDLNDPSGELMTTGAETSAVDEQDASGEVAELSRNGEITEVGEVKEEIQQESVNDDETKAQATWKYIININVQWHFSCINFLLTTYDIINIQYYFSCPIDYLWY